MSPRLCSIRHLGKISYHTPDARAGQDPSRDHEVRLVEELALQYKCNRPLNTWRVLDAFMPSAQAVLSPVGAALVDLK